LRSSLIGKVEKAKKYAQEPERVNLSSLAADFRGEHDSYSLIYTEGKWHCNCYFFSQWGTCSHIMAMQQMLGDMLPKGAYGYLVETQHQEEADKDVQETFLAP
jgi:hypothetical protein